MIENRTSKNPKERQNKSKKAVKDELNIWPLPTVGIFGTKMQDVYIHDFFSKQLDRIEKALWWIVFSICFVGLAILFK